MPTQKPCILFLCTGNACRSQIAEGWAKHLGGERVDILSAGIEAHGKNPRAIAIMKDAGIDISDQESTKVTPEMLAQTTLLVTVCGHADEHCPAVPAALPRIHWPLSDPAKATGNEEEIAAVFAAARDDIRRRVEKLLAEVL